MDKESIVALNRLLRVANDDTGQSKRVADFLLSWWNAEECCGCVTDRPNRAIPGSP